MRLQRRADRRCALRLYLFSLAYLALLFGAMVPTPACRPRRPAMDRNLARKNLRTGLIVTAVCSSCSA